jgi:hypothetical protein
VGQTYNSKFVFPSFVRRAQNGAIVDFHPPGATREPAYPMGAYGINDTGTIVGNHLHTGTVYHAYLLTP